MDNQASEAGDFVGDASDTIIDGGQYETDGQVPIIPPASATQPTPSDTLTNQDAKEHRLEEKKKERSDAEWQDMVEKTKKADQFMNAVAESLGMKPEEVDTSSPEYLQQRIVHLERDNERARWEARHPVALTDKYHDEWDKINAEPRFNSLTFDEKWALVNKERPSTTEREIQQKQLDSQGSVPTPSAAATNLNTGLTPEEQEIARAGGLTEEDFKAAGML